MSQAISTTAVIYAILAIDSEIALQKDYLFNSEVPSDEREDEEEVLADLEQAFMEFVDVYKDRRKTDKELPTLEELLSSQL
jgi:hypothetical protein